LTVLSAEIGNDAEDQLRRERGRDPGDHLLVHRTKRVALLEEQQRRRTTAGRQLPKAIVGLTWAVDGLADDAHAA
jgi:hypothetical protein